VDLWSYDQARNKKNKGDNHKAAETDAAQISNPDTRGPSLARLLTKHTETASPGYLAFLESELTIFDRNLTFSS
jgi:hypothetical protein